MATATIFRKQQTLYIDFHSGELVSEILIAGGISFSMPCSGNHSCGKCKVRVTGQLDSVSSQERIYLTALEQKNNLRLACFAHALGNVEIFLDDRYVSPEVLTFTALPQHKLTNHGWGIAVDIGTTTVALQLYNLDTGVLHATECGENAQISFGSDIISRISYSNQHGKEILHKYITTQLNAYAQNALSIAGISQINSAVVTGNTTMLHFWENLDPKDLAIAPFIPQSLFGYVGTETLLGENVFLPPCIGSYVGADIVCAILASNMLGTPHITSLLIDMGTNGEIAVWHQGHLYCAATAMGPAFEGAGLDYGMSAKDGAISGIKKNSDGHYDLTVIGDIKATGICASGIVDIIAEMLDADLLSEGGQITLAQESSADEQNVRWRIPETDVYISQRDIRQVQLAKAAVSAGIETLLKRIHLRTEDIQRFYIAGGFGNYINLENAKKIGLLPQKITADVKLLGNGALSGAALMLLDEEYRKKAFVICDLAEEIELSGDKLFSEYYMNNIIFET